MRLESRYLPAIVLFVAIYLSGCAFITMPLFPSTQALQERVIEGEGKDKILLLDISGVISEKKRSGLSLQQETTMIENIKEALNKAERDVAIKGLILRINSPGGTITGSDILYHELIQFKKRKEIRIIACLMDIGASGGYYVANAADEIIAHPTTITGSIGVIALKFNVKGLLELVGIEEETIKSGKMKDLWSPFRPSTEKERKIMQVIIDKFHSRFVDVIKEGRKDLTRKEIEALADGRIYSADQALDAKLIDRTGYMDDAFDSMKKSLGITEATIIAYERPGTYRGTIYSGSVPPVPRILNFIAANDNGLLSPPGVQFMYLWMP